MYYLQATVRNVHQGGGDRAAIPSLRAIQRSMYRARTENAPRAPKTLTDVDIQPPYSNTFGGEPFLSHHEAANNVGFTIFSTEEDYLMLEGCRECYMDATYSCCPGPYKQYFTIHANVRGQVIQIVSVLMTGENIFNHVKVYKKRNHFKRKIEMPFYNDVYIFLVGKTEEMYRDVFAVVKAKVLQVTGREWRPTSVICDFEQALHRALNVELPNCSILGCYFHYCQSLWKKTRNLGLEEAYRGDEETTKVVRRAMSIGFLPVGEIDGGFAHLRRRGGTVQAVQANPQLDVFLDYVERNYINGNTFPKALWNVHNRTMINRTNNHCEGYYSKFNKIVTINHPTLWVFIGHMKDEQNVRSDIFVARERGDAPPQPARKWRNHERAIEHLKDEFRGGNITRNVYWKGITHHIANYM